MVTSKIENALPCRNMGLILVAHICVCVCARARARMLARIYIQCVPGGKDLTPGGCSLGQTIPIKPKTPLSKAQWLRRYLASKSEGLFGVCVLYSVRDVILVYA